MMGPSASNALGDSSPHRDVLEIDIPQDEGSKLRLIEECKNRAKGCVGAKDYFNARLLFQRALELEETTTSMGKVKDAQENAKHAVEHDATYVKGYWRLAASYLAQSKPELALEQINIAVGLEPTNRALIKEREKLEMLVEVEEMKKTKKQAEKEEEQNDDSSNATTLPKPTPKPETTKKDVEMKDSTNTTPKQSNDVEMKDAAPPKKTTTTTTTTTTKPTTTKQDNSGDFTSSDHVRGYKIVNGKKTSFFHHEQTEEEKRLIGDIAPKRIDVTNNTQPSPEISTTTMTTTATTNPNNNTSAWNQAGTWEEKNVSEWASTTLKEKCMEASFLFPSSSPAPNAIASVKHVKFLDDGGHASVATVRGKKRYIYEYAIQIKWQVTGLGEKEGPTNVTRGSMTFPDVDGTCVVGEGYDMMDYCVEKVAAPGLSPLLDRFVKNGGLRDAIHDALDAFVHEFRKTY